MRIKAKLKDGIVSVKMMAKHIMLSKAEAKRQGKTANYITSMIGSVGDTIVFEANTSQTLSRDPYVKYYFKGAKKGDTLKMVWKDLLGNEKIDTATIK
jgi:sulfur-oxidizing protein SoxZ